MNKLQQILFWLFAILLFGMGYLFNGGAFISSIFVIIAIVVISPPFICYQEHKNPDNWNKNVSLLIVFGCFVLSAVFSPWFTQEPQVNKVSEEAIQTVIVEEVIPPAEETDSSKEVVKETSEKKETESTAKKQTSDQNYFNGYVYGAPYSNEYYYELWGYSDTEKNNQNSTSSSSSKKTNESKKEDEKKVYVTEYGEKYHRKGCQYLSQSAYEISLKSAQRKGYEPCSVCDP